MRVQVAGRQMDVGEALRSRIEADMATGISKYFNRATDATVTVSRNGGTGMAVDCAVHLASGISLQTQGHGGDAHSAFDDAMTKLEKRVRRYKRRLRNHHVEQKTPLPAEDAASYVLAPLDEDKDASEPFPDAPLVIAETKVPIRTMTVSMAVMELDLADRPALLFRNAVHGGFNLVYRRSDGNVGWVDPDRVRPNGAANGAGPKPD